MNINSTEFARGLEEIIDKIALKIVREELSKFGNMRGWSAKVTDVSGNTATVKLAGDEVPIPNLKNKTGVTLDVGDEVFLYSISSLSNAYIAVAKDKP